MNDEINSSLEKMTIQLEETRSKIASAIKPIEDLYINYSLLLQEIDASLEVLRQNKEPLNQN